MALPAGAFAVLADFRQGVPVEMVVHPRQPHGLQAPRFLKDAMERTLAWFDRWLKGEGS